MILHHMHIQNEFLNEFLNSFEFLIQIEFLTNYGLFMIYKLYIIIQNHTIKMKTMVQAGIGLVTSI